MWACKEWIATVVFVISQHKRLSDGMWSRLLLCYLSFARLMCHFIIISNDSISLNLSVLFIQFHWLPQNYFRKFATKAQIKTATNDKKSKGIRMWKYLKINFEWRHNILYWSIVVHNPFHLIADWGKNWREMEKNIKSIHDNLVYIIQECWSRFLTTTTIIAKCAVFSSQIESHWNALANCRCRMQLLAPKWYIWIVIWIQNIKPIASMT